MHTDNRADMRMLVPSNRAEKQEDRDTNNNRHNCEAQKTIRREKAWATREVGETENSDDD